MKVALTVFGGSDLSKRLAELSHSVSRSVQLAALKKGAEPIRDMAESLAPIDEQAPPPHLADNIIITTARASHLESEGLFDRVAVYIGPAVRFFWGYFQEFGTVKQPAHPFMRPAFDTQHRLSLQIIASELWIAIRRRLGAST